MDFIDSRTRNITALALDGLYARSKAIASNTANVLTPNYQRKDITFEHQLQNVIQDENLKDEMKIANTIKFQQNPVAALKNQDPAQIAFMQANSSEGFKPEIMEDLSDPTSENGNNVILEKEMMAAARTGTQYTMLSSLMAKSFQGLERVIKGQ